MDSDEPLLHTLHFNVTNSCNLSCSFCYIDAVRAKVTVIPIERVRSLAEEARAVGGIRVIVSGGETFMRDDWEEILWAFADLGWDVSIVSNGTLLKEQTIEKLSALPRLSILVSLDGDAIKNDQIRGARGAQRKTVSAIAQLRAHDIDVQVNATIIQDNLSEVAYLTKLSRDLDVSMRFSLLNPYNGRGAEVTSAALNVRQVLALREYCHDARKLGSRIFLNIPPLLQFVEDVIPMRSPACGWTKSYCGVTYDGFVTICGVSGADETLHVGNIMNKSFADIWKSAPLFNYLRSLSTHSLKGVCAKCVYRDSCGGACRLSAYKAKNDFTESYSMCEAFYQAGVVDSSRIDENAGPLESAPAPPPPPPPPPLASLAGYGSEG